MLNIDNNYTSNNINIDNTNIENNNENNFKNNEIYLKNNYDKSKENNDRIQSIVKSISNYSLDTTSPYIKEKQSYISNYNNFSLVHNNYNLIEEFSDNDWKLILDKKVQPDHDRLVHSIKKGIKDELRGKIWIYLSKCLDNAVNYSPEIYKKLINIDNTEALDLIKKDLARTSANTKNETLKQNLIKKKDKLSNILLAYANFDIEVGYVQGTNYIVNTILSNLNSERATFWIYVHIMNNLNWRYLYIDGMPKLKRMIKVLEEVMKKKVLDIYKHIKSLESDEEEKYKDNTRLKNNKKTKVLKLAVVNNEEEDEGLLSALFMPYFISIFCYCNCIEYANRILDLFWLYEEKIIIETIIHLLTINKEEILKTDMGLLFCCVRDLVDNSIHKFGFENCFPNLDKF